MNASELYQLFVGEIGIPRREYLFELDFWEARLIYKGYRNRYKDMWTAMRWQAFNIMSSMSNLSKAGIRKPSDLLSFPWDKPEPSDLPSEEEIERTRKELQELNKK